MAHEGQATIRNRQGMHVRPASNLAKVATEFKSEVWLTVDGNRVNAKSPIECLMLGAPQGAVLTITCDGPDSEQALKAVLALVENWFGMGEND